MLGCKRFNKQFLGKDERQDSSASVLLGSPFSGLSHSMNAEAA